MIPHRVEIDVVTGEVRLSKRGAASVLDAIRDELVDDVTMEMQLAAAEVSAEAGNNSPRGSDHRLPWFVAAEIGRWPYRTGQSSGLLGRGIPILQAGSQDGKEHTFIAMIPPGTGLNGDTLEYMAEIEHEGRGELPPLFLLDDTMRGLMDDWDAKFGPYWAEVAERLV